MTFGNLSADTQGSLLMRDLANFLAFGSWVYTGPRLFKDAKALLKAELLPYDFNLLYRRDFMEALRNFPIESLISEIGKITDPRKPRGIRHPSKTGKLYSYDSQKRYPYFLSSLGFARERTYSLLVRGKVFLQFVSKDEINSFNNYTPNHNPLLLNDYQKYVFLYSIVENDGALLNFTLTPYFIELGGRVNLGEGALDFKVYEAQDEIFIFSPDTIDVRFKKKIETKFLKITKRPIKPIFEEVKMKDRQELDSAILEALGLDPKVYLPKIYEGLCELVRERLELPKVRKKARKTKTKRDIEKLKEDVIREILPEGVKKFPEDFWDVSIKRGKFKELDLPDQPLEISQPFLGEITISSKNEFTYKTRNPSEAKYLKYAHYNGAYRVKIPVEPIFILKTVSAYERYIRDLKNRLFEAFYNRIHDQKLSHNLTQSALETLKLPEIQSK